jgi:cytochrome oxidase Cu insertion factor (SCO1/SenC/PrrC family)
VVNALILGLAIRAFVPTLQAGDAVPALPLVDQTGRAFTLADLRGNVIVVSFLYTSCGDARACPLVAAKLGRMQRAIGRAPIRLVALSLDPVHDTPAALRAYGAAYNADPSRWRLATGPPPAVEELVARFGITSLAMRERRGFVHDEAAIVIDRAGRIVTIVPGNRWTAGDLFALAARAAGAPVDPWTAARLWLATAAETCGGGAGAFTTAGALGVLGLALAITGFAFARAFGAAGRTQ